MPNVERSQSDGDVPTVGGHNDNGALSSAGSGALVPAYSQLVYFSSVSGNTHRFMQKLRAAGQREGQDLASDRLPLRSAEGTLLAQRPFVLVVPTYGGLQFKNYVPKQVIKFLNVEQNRNLLAGVISAGNTNFGEDYCLAGKMVASKCKVPHLYRFELMGTPEDVEKIRKGLERFWARQLWKK